jgi:hypothetical protein
MWILVQQVQFRRKRTSTLAASPFRRQASRSIVLQAVSHARAAVFRFQFPMLRFLARGPIFLMPLMIRLFPFLIRSGVMPLSHLLEGHFLKTTTTLPHRMKFVIRH